MDQLYIEKYVKDDKCDWLVLLHGFGGSSKMWKRQIESFKDKFNLFILDLPGHGQSKEGIAKKHIDKFVDVADIVVQTLKENGIYKATFMCVSLGTLVFAGILTRYPDIVNGAILCGAVAGVNKFIEIGLHFINCIKNCLPYMFLMGAFSYFLLPRKSHKTSREFFIKSGKLLGKEEFMAWFNLVISDFDILKNLSDFKKKILFIMGNEDYTFLNGVCKKITDFKNAGLSIINHCGHVCNIQKSREFNEVALGYIETELCLS